MLEFWYLLLIGLIWTKRKLQIKLEPRHHLVNGLNCSFLSGHGKISRYHSSTNTAGCIIHHHHSGKHTYSLNQGTFFELIAMYWHWRINYSYRFISKEALSIAALIRFVVNFFSIIGPGYSGQDSALFSPNFICYITKRFSIEG